MRRKLVPVGDIKMEEHQGIQGYVGQSAKSISKEYHRVSLTCAPKPFVFIHIPKTAGVSISTAIGAASIATEMGLPAEQHTSARWLRDRMGKELYESKFSFSIVRNSWDRMVSLWKFRRDPTAFDTFIRNIPTNMYPYDDPNYIIDIRYRNTPTQDGMTVPQLHFLTDEQGNTIVNKIYRFEHLQEAMVSINERLGTNYKLPHLNKSKRDHYSIYYDNETRDIVAEVYQEEIEFFGYTFEADKEVEITF